MSDISPSAIKSDAEFEKAVSECTDIESIKNLMHERELQQGLVRRDPFNAEVLHPVEQPATATRIARTVTVNGVTKIVEGANEAEVAAAELAYLRSLAPTTDAQPRSSDGRFVSAEEQGRIDEAEQLEIVRKADLELRFKRGELNTEQYLIESGALQRAFETHIERVQTERAADEVVVKSWQQATEEFRNSAAGTDWIGGQENLLKISEVLREMGAENYPSAESLRRAWQHMKENHLFVETPESKMKNEILNAKSAEEIRDALGMNDRARSSGVFGSR